jgi:Glycosyltransferase family 87
MRRRLVVPTLLALVAAAACGWAELVDYLWTDYEWADEPPLRALVHGDLAGFFHAAPVEGPSLLLRAPFALIPSLWGGGSLAVFRMVAVPGLLAVAILAVVLWVLRERTHPTARWSLLVVLLVAGNPIALRALDMGHPEELLGAALCVGAVLAAVKQRPWIAAVLLGLALGNKAWAVLAIGPVLVALDRRRWSAVALACFIGALFVVPFLLVGASSRGAVALAGSTDGIFQPWQLWWPLGEHGHVIRGFFGTAKPGYRAAPDWIGPLTHPLIALLVVPATFAWWRRHGWANRSVDVLLLLATLFLARCVLDAANNAYYHLPFLLALLAWEALGLARPPVLSLAAAGLVWLVLVKLPLTLTPDAQCAAYLAVALPALAALTYATYRRPRAEATVPAAVAVPAAA